MTTSPSRLTDRYFLASLAVVVAVITYFRDPIYLPLLLIPVAVGLVRIGLPALRARVGVSTVDLDLLSLLIHMYSVSTGKPPRKRLFELNCVVGDYGDYDKILRKIASLAVDWAYGFVSAIRYVAREVRNSVFRDFLLRFSEVLRTGEDPTIFLETELAAARRNYQSQYYRAVDAMRIILGLHTTVMSASTFVLAVISIMMLFTGGDPGIYILTFIGSLTLAASFTAVVYVVVPKEWIIPKVKPRPPHLFRRYRLALFVGISLALFLGYLAYRELGGVEYALLAAGIPLLLPGLVARSIENGIKKLEPFYAIFIRSFGLTYAIIPNYAKSLSSTMMGNLGPLSKPLARVYSRISNGIDPRTAWRYFIYDTWSNLVMRATNIFVETADVGGNTRIVGTLLSDLITRVNDLRSLRERTARTFEATAYIMQALVSAIVVVIITIVRTFSNYIRTLAASLETAEFYGLPLLVLPPEVIEFMSLLAMLFLAILTVLNALTIKVAYGGIPESFWLQVSILLVITSGSVIGVRIMVETLLGGLLIPPIPV